MHFGLDGKVAIVTGAGSGIGRAAAQAFALEGVKVVVAEISSKSGLETVQMIEKSGGEAVFVETDVSRGTDVEKMVNTAVKHYGSLDIAFNNAGIAVVGVPLTDYSEQEWEQVISTNLKGVWLCMKYEIQKMLHQGNGVIVNNASTFGLVGGVNVSAYVASKHGIVGLTRAAAIEYARENIRINAVCPGSILTPAVKETIKSSPHMKDEMLASMPVNRFGKPEEIADTVIWLCSGAASFITGQAIAVDGGWTAV